MNQSSGMVSLISKWRHTNRRGGTHFCDTNWRADQQFLCDRGRSILGQIHVTSFMNDHKERGTIPVQCSLTKTPWEDFCTQWSTFWNRVIFFEQAIGTVCQDFRSFCISSIFWYVAQFLNSSKCRNNLKRYHATSIVEFWAHSYWGQLLVILCLSTWKKLLIKKIKASLY